MLDFLRKLYQRIAIPYETKKIKPQKNWGSLIIGTKRGLYQLINKDLKIIRLGEYYGITFFGDFVYVLNKKNAKTAVVLSYKIRQGKIIKNSKKTFIRNLDPAIHQIDFFNNHFYLTDTHNNRIIKTDKNGKNHKHYYPLGSADNGKKSPNYGHINSIFYNGNYVYLMCHNMSKHSGKKSEILKTDPEFNVIEKIKTSAECAHNIIINEGKYYICDSLNSHLRVNNEVRFTANEFTRGLAMTKSEITIGDSNYARRNMRNQAYGSLYLLNHQGELISSTKIPGMVQEIRRIDEIDLGLSQNAIKK